ncbi:hypothetical protein K458DRAFT_421687 [Lentithecium fluviatile CBS 122367]|uniref:Uncharacterized protein n=1 Tax=Lentithecium fluviatile CBS 122367 TaxID=1168545 RepID=A0A6G1IQC0_9PLEO|nr:hypothetical protein K458DRAFT_421687 [Lentithecium fluviatile CBS 122367]
MEPSGLYKHSKKSQTRHQFFSQFICIALTDTLHRHLYPPIDCPNDPLGPPTPPNSSPNPPILKAPSATAHHSRAPTTKSTTPPIPSSASIHTPTGTHAHAHVLRLAKLIPHSALLVHHLLCKFQQPLALRHHVKVSLWEGVWVVAVAVGAAPQFGGDKDVKGHFCCILCGVYTVLPVLLVMVVDVCVSEKTLPGLCGVAAMYAACCRLEDCDLRVVAAWKGLTWSIVLQGQERREKLDTHDGRRSMKWMITLKPHGVVFVVVEINYATSRCCGRGGVCETHHRPWSEILDLMHAEWA